MQNNANVASVEQLEVLHHRLMHYRSKMEKEIDLLSLENRRLENWINNEAPQYWQSEFTLAQRRLAECKDALTRCQSYVREDERRPCTEEKKRLDRAIKRSRLCEEMLRRVRAAQQHWQREHVKNLTKIQRLRDVVDTDLLVAATQLQKDIDSLHRYASVTSRPTRSNLQQQIDAKGPSETDSDTNSDAQGTSQ